MANFFDPPKAKELISKDKVDSTYKGMRWKVFIGSFLGYAAYYLVRKNLSLAAPDMIEDGIVDKVGVGIAMSGVSIAYAFSKFIMGSISDRSDARKFLVVGLLLAALTMLTVGLIPYGINQTVNVGILFVLMLAVGWISGMGWPPCGRIMAHWFSQNERSFKMSLWNTSHNLGGGTLGLLVTSGVIIFASMGINETWRAAFIVPSLVALVVAVFCWWALRDTPTSCGLPTINEWRNDYSGVKSKTSETEKLPFKTLFFDYILKNKFLWIIALANAFVYMVRYGVGDWAPVYLQEMNIMDARESNLAFALHNYAAIPGTIACGWISSKFFKGRCTPPNILYMSIVLLGILFYWQAGSIAEFLTGSGASIETINGVAKYIVYASLCLVGFSIYGPVALIGIQALNLVPKNAAGTSAGFVGLFGYLLGDAILSKLIMGSVAESMGWSATFIMLAVASVFAIILCSFTWKAEKNLAR